MKQLNILSVQVLVSIEKQSKATIKYVGTIRAITVVFHRRLINSRCLMPSRITAAKCRILRSDGGSDSQDTGNEDRRTEMEKDTG